MTERVTLFVTCMVDQVYPEIGMAAARVLERLGVEVVVPRSQTCCGQPAFNSGFTKEAWAVAKRFLDVFDGDSGEGDDGRTQSGNVPIVVPSGSCGAMVRNFYPELFHDDPAALARARAVGKRVFEFSEFIVDRLGRTDLGGDLRGKLGGRIDDVPGDPPPCSAAYHQCCHLLRELHVDRQPKALLEHVRGLELRPLEKAEVCCGFGGTFAIKLPEISTAMMDEKLHNVAASGAQMLIAGDAGCLMHMDGGMRRRGMKVRALHYAEVLDMATSGHGS